MPWYTHDGLSIDIGVGESINSSVSARHVQAHWATSAPTTHAPAVRGALLLTVTQASRPLTTCRHSSVIPGEWVHGLQPECVPLDRAFVPARATFVVARLALYRHGMRVTATALPSNASGAPSCSPARCACAQRTVAAAEPERALSRSQTGRQHDGLLAAVTATGALSRALEGVTDANTRGVPR